MRNDSRLVRTDSQPRILVIAALLVLCGVLCMGRLFAWHTVDRARIIAAGGLGTSSTEEERPNRGTITDRTGSVVLAETVLRHNVYAQPSQMGSDERVAVEKALSSALSLGAEEVQRIRLGLASERAWVTLLTGLDDAQSSAVRAALADVGSRFTTLGEVRMRNYRQVGGAHSAALRIVEAREEVRTRGLLRKTVGRGRPSHSH